MKNFEFFDPICAKKDLGLGTEKTNVGIRLSIAEIPYMPIFWNKRTTLTFSGPNLPQNGF